MWTLLYVFRGEKHPHRIPISNLSQHLQVGQSPKRSTCTVSVKAENITLACSDLIILSLSLNHRPHHVSTGHFTLDHPTTIQPTVTQYTVHPETYWPVSFTGTSSGSDTSHPSPTHTRRDTTRRIASRCRWATRTPPSSSGGIQSGLSTQSLRTQGQNLSLSTCR